jgi:hypothetical protein
MLPCSIPAHLKRNIRTAVWNVVNASSQSAKSFCPFSLSHTIQQGDDAPPDARDDVIQKVIRPEYDLIPGNPF